MYRVVASFASGATTLFGTRSMGPAKASAPLADLLGILWYRPVEVVCSIRSLRFPSRRDSLQVYGTHGPPNRNFQTFVAFGLLPTREDCDQIAEHQQDGVLCNPTDTNAVIAGTPAVSRSSDTLRTQNLFREFGRIRPFSRCGIYPIDACRRPPRPSPQARFPRRTLETKPYSH